VKKPSALLALLLSLTLLPLSPVPAQAKVGNSHELKLTPVVSGLSAPLDLRSPDGSGKLFIVELTGKIRVFTNGKLNKKPFLNLTPKLAIGGEQGLLGLAFHPDYADNGLFYVYYTKSGGDVVVSEFSVSAGNPNVANPNSERVLLEIDEPFSNHNGGGLAFGPSGYLYIAVGDGGSGGDPFGNGQNTNTLLGSLLRIDVDNPSGGKEYGIPPDNPFNSGGGLEEIFAYGLRNPWRISVDQLTGRVFIGDVGQGAREEIDVVNESVTSATNFGWNVMEGTICYSPSTGCNKAGKKLPVLDYPNPAQGSAVIGGYVYRGSSIPWLRGTYFYSDLSGRFLKSFRLVNGKAKERTNWTPQVGLLPSSVYGFGQDGHGELYVLSGSTVYRIDDANPARCDINGDGDDDLMVGARGDRISQMIGAGSLSVLPSSSGRPAGSGNTLWHQDRPGVGDVAKADEHFGHVVTCGDFDGDGYDDVAVGAPNNTTPINVVGGSVNVFYGSPGGLGSPQLFRQGEAGLGEVSDAGDGFGAALAAGDFDGDGYEDLAIGVPGENVASLPAAGRINVIYGSPGGLKAAGSISWSQKKAGISGTPQQGDEFGGSLAAGDFDGDGYADLAVGVPGEDVGSMGDAGRVQVLFGKRSGLTMAGDLSIDHDDPGIAGIAGSGDSLGAALAAGSIDGDGFDDLVVGAPGYTVSGKSAGGTLHYFPGSASGPGADGDRLLNLDSANITAGAKAGDALGVSIDIGDIDGDGFGDIAAGIPFRDVAGISNAGAALVVFGGSKGPTGNDQFLNLNTPGVVGGASQGDRFGSAVALLDFEEDGRLDLAVGAPLSTVAGTNDAGVVCILYGKKTGIVTAGNLRLHQDKPNVNGSAQKGDYFGGSIGH
jgi:glucose/arabinose dehydrogenase